MNDPFEALRVFTPPQTGDAEVDLAGALALLAEVGDGAGPALRIYRPAAAVAFSRRDQREGGYLAAREVARRAGYAPVLRTLGGRAAAYGPGSLIIDRVELVRSEPDAIKRRFDRLVEPVTELLRTQGFDAQIGELPGEYCPGEHSIHVAGRIKVAGVAQRVARGAALTSLVLNVTGGAALRAVVADVYPALGLPVDPARTGALDDLDPEVRVEAVKDALVAALA